MREGHVGRAAKALYQTVFLDPTKPAVLQQLTKMHPASRVPTPECPDLAPFTLLTNTLKIHKFIRNKICRGQAPVPSGWTWEMLLPLLEKAYIVDETKYGQFF